jgi:hypothetical protein
VNADPVQAARYARALERALAQASGRAVVMSPRDFALLSGWLARGVPLALVVEQIEHRKAKGKDVRSLASIASAVEHQWSAVVDGRVGATRSSGPAGPAAPAADPQDDATVLAEASSDAVARAERAADAALSPWRAKMTPAAFASTRRRAILDHLRARRS